MSSHQISKENSAFRLFCVSYFLRYLGIGMYITIFNLYIASMNFSGSFLGTFLAVGNLSMAIFSVPLGQLIDRVSKTNVLISLTLVASICFFLQATILNESILLIVSAVYGVAFIGLLNATAPFLYGLKALEKGKNFIMTTRAIALISSTLGAVICGVLSLIGRDNQGILFIATFILLSSAVPIIFVPKIIPIAKEASSTSEIAGAKQIQKSNGQRKTLIISSLLVFFFLGFAPLIQNFVNLYFSTRYHLANSDIAFIVATVTLLIGVVVIASSKLKIRSPQSAKIGFALLGFGILLLNITSVIFDNIFIHVVGIFLILGLFQVYYALTYDMILSNTKNSLHGKISGFINMSSNLSETFGIYLCSLLIIGLRFDLIFVISAVSTLFVTLTTLFVVKFMNKEYT